MAHNVWRLGEGCLTDAQFSHKLSGSFCQTAVTCWAVYLAGFKKKEQNEFRCLFNTKKMD